MRTEHFEDSDGLRSGTGQNINELTAKLEHKWRNNVLSRLEFRHDRAGIPSYPAGGGGMSHHQDTRTVGHIVQF